MKRWIHRSFRRDRACMDWWAPRSLKKCGNLASDGANVLRPNRSACRRRSHAKMPRQIASDGRQNQTDMDFRANSCGASLCRRLAARRRCDGREICRRAGAHLRRAGRRGARRGARESDRDDRGQRAEPAAQAATGARARDARGADHAPARGAGDNGVICGRLRGGTQRLHRERRVDVRAAPWSSAGAARSGRR